MKLEFIGAKSKIFTPEDTDIAEKILETLKENSITLRNNDTIIIASKVISTIEGCRIRFTDIKKIREEALLLAEISDLDPRFVEIVFRESDEVIGAVPGAVLALRDGILQANSGVDQSNSGGKKFLITLPKKPIETADKIRSYIEKELKITIGVIIADSKTHPLRRGTSGFALAVSGFSPIIDDRGSKDLFDRAMKITTRAIADNLACAAQILMGESNQSIPIVIARGNDHIPFQEIKDNYSNNAQMKIDPSHCIYIGPLWKNKRL